MGEDNTNSIITVAEVQKYAEESATAYEELKYNIEKAIEEIEKLILRRRRNGWGSTDKVFGLYDAMNILYRHIPKPKDKE